jgi:hypothetical protein
MHHVSWLILTLDLNLFMYKQSHLLSSLLAYRTFTIIIFARLVFESFPFFRVPQLIRYRFSDIVFDS